MPQLDMARPSGKELFAGSVALHGRNLHRALHGDLHHQGLQDGRTPAVSRLLLVCGRTTADLAKFRNSGELLASSWDKLDPGLQQKLTEIGISPPPPTPEPDLQDVLRDNLAQLPAPVKELVEKITKPQPPTEKDVANKLKQQVSSLRDLSHRKQHLQSKIDATKKAFQDLLNEMKLIQT